ncbi:MAG: cytochrome c [Chloracidobacterium sp.]|nr:cytochrome c [Chloracidobacterium sp.]
MKSNRIKLIAILIFAALVGLLMFFRSTPVRGAAMPDTAADLYKAKCAMCHTPVATKFFDPAKADEELVKAILTGKKAEKPPNMPSYGDKGVDENMAKALAAYMKDLRQPK